LEERVPSVSGISGTFSTDDYGYFTTGVDTEVDDRGSQYYEIQVKSLRGWSYIFIPKEKLTPTDQRLVAVVHYLEHMEPTLYLVPSTEWLRAKSSLLVDRDYGQNGQKSKPEWGLNLSRKNQELLSKFQLHQVAASPPGSHRARSAPSL
jgi:hypothetical protein